MNKYVRILFLAFSFIIFSSGVSFAITVTATPDPAKVGEAVTITATTGFLGVTPNCQLEINYGDNSGWVDMGVGCTIDPCTVTVTHTYAKPGTNTIRVRHDPVNCNPPLPVPPDPATTTITIAEPLSIDTLELPLGIVDVRYRYQLEVSGGHPPKTFSRRSGSLPPGLKLSSSGLISGTPRTAGTFKFTVRVKDSIGQTAEYKYLLRILAFKGLPPEATIGVRYRYKMEIIGAGPNTSFALRSGSLPPGLKLSSSGLISGTPTKIGTFRFKLNVKIKNTLGSPAEFELTIIVNKATLSVKTTPSSFRIARGARVSKTLSYSFSSTAPINTTLRSTKGEFLTNPKVGDFNRPLTVKITNGKGRATETIAIPPSVSKRAEKYGSSRVTYTRTFTSNITTPLTARVTISFTRGAGAELWINRISIHFENKRPKLTVKRNEKVGHVYADIRYDGTGLLKGYWKVDGRILSRVQKHLTYGRSFTFKTPDIPVIPTFAEGSHRIKFIITEPSQDIRFPEAIYYVTAEEAIKKHVITLIEPRDMAEIVWSPALFSWKGSDRDVVYLIEFLIQDDEKPFFSAYSKAGEYKLPDTVLTKMFSPGTSYTWRVKGYDKDNNLIGESPESVFTFLKRASYLPGQILLVTQDTKKSRLLVEELGRKYNLRLLESYNLNTLNMRIAVFYTEDEIAGVMNAIMKEEGIISVQPNYIFRTMDEPMSEMQNIFSVLNLSKMHEQYRGKGVPVAIVDTGVDVDHRDLKDRIKGSDNFIKDSSYKAEIHGTAVAGIIGASINGFGIEGVAPEADILALRACRQVSEDHPEGECYTSSVSQALDMAIEKGARVVNMSLGSTAPDSLIINLLEEGRKRGVIFVAPVGNRLHKKELSFPASHPAVVAVCGTDDKGNPYPNQEIASKAKACAPATNVFTTVPGDQHNFMSGTSMSSAVVSGLLAVAYSKNGGVDIDKLPAFNGNLNKWKEELLKINICEK